MSAKPIIIIGGGPVGMMLALNLAALGTRSVLINTQPGPRWHPKGSTQNSRTMEHYRRLGIIDSIRSTGLPKDLPTDVTYFTSLSGYELSRLRMPSEQDKLAARDRAPADDQVVEPIFRCNQMHAEARIFEHVQACPLIDRRYGWDCVAWSEQPDGVTVEIVEAETGKRETIGGSYLAGCDGGHGIVRRQLGVAYLGETPTIQPYLGGPMVSTYLRAPELASIAGTNCWQYWVVNHDVRSNIVAVDGKTEFLFSTRLERPDQTPDDAMIAAAFRASIGRDIKTEFIAHATWTAGQAFVAERFGQGRAWMAGDSVHLFTPTGGFGMNTGVDDAANLAWKLAGLAQGWGGPKLAESYETERRPIAFRNTGASKALARNVGATPVSSDIDKDTPAGVEARQKAHAYLSGVGPEFASLGVQLGARYDTSPIIVRDGAPPADNLFDYRPSGAPGGRAPHVWIGEGRGIGDSIYDRFARSFTVLRLGKTPQDVDGLVAAFKARGIPMAVLDVSHSAARDLYERDIAIIRPDHHVAWRGNHCPSDADKVVGQIVGH
jgi:2-polyprenyl-6-methoxyphenol hydroxylase-like FAD-dependent oxidoreductase